MKSINDVELHAVMSAPPRRSHVPNEKRVGGADYQIIFPAVWTEKGQAYVMVCTAIGRTAEEIMRWVLPGEPLLITGSLRRRDGQLLCQVTDAGRLVSAQRTVTTSADSSALLALDGGHCRITARGHIEGDGVAQGEYFRGAMLLRTLPNAQKETKTQLIDLLSPVPVLHKQAVSLVGTLRVRVGSDDPQMLTALSVSTAEDLSVPANLSSRDPQDRLRVGKLGPDTLNST